MKKDNNNIGNDKYRVPVKTESLSSLCKTPFYNFNEPKRIMMTSKGLTQSIPVDGSINNVTNELPARVVFGDLEGFNSGDAIIISESMRKRLNSSKQEVIYVNTSVEVNEIVRRILDHKGSYPLTVGEYEILKGFSKNDFLRCKNIRAHEVKELTNSRNKVYGYKIFITYQVAFNIGDKITNFHGSKGVVSKILPDDKMPRLIKDVGNIKAGPFDVIISAYSITKRGTMGQILEVLNSIYGIESFEEVNDKQIDELSQPLIEYKGKLSTHIFGIQSFVRFYHLSVSHSTFSGFDKSTFNLLNFGQQEKMHMASQCNSEIMKEFQLRSNKVSNRKFLENELIINKDNTIDRESSLSIIYVLYSLGYDFNMNDDTIIIKNLEIGPNDVKLTPGKSTIRTNTKNGFKKIISGEGIYDKDKFKKVYTCECGFEGRKNHICSKCNTVADKIRKYYIEMNNIYPNIMSNYKNLSKYNSTIKDFLEFKTFLYDGEILTFTNKSEEFEGMEEDKFFYGIDAVRELYKDDESFMEEFDSWVDKYTSKYFFIPAYTFRKPIVSGKKVIKKDINTSYEKFFEENAKTDSLIGVITNKFQKFMVYNRTYKIKEDAENLLFDILKTGKNSIISKECVSQKVSGTIRGTIVPNITIDEDETNIGLAFADSLYPEFTGLWSTPEELNYLISKGCLEIPLDCYKIPDDILDRFYGKDKLDYIYDKYPDVYDKYAYLYPWRVKEYINNNCEGNEEEFWEVFSDALMLIKIKLWEYYINNQSDIPYLLLINRPPTIGQLSFGVVKPIFGKNSTKEELQNVEDSMRDIISKFNKEGLIDLEGYGSTFLVDNVNYNCIDEDGNEIIDGTSSGYSEEISVSRSFDMWSKYDEDININVDLIEINPIIFDGFAEDCDGDINWVGSLMSKQALIAAQEMLMSKNYKTISNDEIRNCMPPEAMYAMQNIYENNPELAEQIHEMIINNQQ